MKENPEKKLEDILEGPQLTKWKFLASKGAKVTGITIQFNLPSGSSGEINSYGRCNLVTPFGAIKGI